MDTGSSGGRDREGREDVDKKLKDGEFLKRLHKELRMTYTNEEIEKLDEDEIYKIIIKQGLIEQLVKNGNDMHAAPQAQAWTEEAASENVGLEELNMRMTVHEAKAFTEYKDNSSSDRKLRIAISFLKCRKLTKPVQASLNPIFDQTFALSFGGSIGWNQSTYDYLLRLKTPLSLVVVEENAKTGERVLLSEKSIEWRYVLVHKSLTLNLELAHKQRAKGVLGMLKVSVQLATQGGERVKVVEQVLEKQLEDENAQRAVKAAEFYEYSMKWYNEYRSLKNDFGKRSVKIYADNISNSMKPIVSYVCSLKLRAVDSPEDAHRFVSLIPYVKPADADQTLVVWRNFHSFLVEGRGEVQDHASLLCSLLLGFGLDAYVCIGSCSDGPHCWVLVRNVEKEGGAVKMTCTFWESLTGERYNQNDPRVNYLYRRIGCAFNDKKYYANVQEVDTAFRTSLYFEDTSRWKCMKDMSEYHRCFSTNDVLKLLVDEGRDREAEEERMEQELKQRVKEYRDNKKYFTRFDDALANALSSAAKYYELNKSLGKKLESDLFQQAVKHNIPDNHIFKAFPIQVNHLASSSIFDIILNNATSSDILNTIGDNIHFAFRCKIFSYPERVQAVWIIFSVYYIAV